MRRSGWESESESEWGGITYKREDENAVEDMGYYQCLLHQVQFDALVFRVGVDGVVEINILLLRQRVVKQPKVEFTQPMHFGPGLI